MSTTAPEPIFDQPVDSPPPDRGGGTTEDVPDPKDPADYVDENPSAEDWANGIFNSATHVYDRWQKLWPQIKSIATKRKLDAVALAAVALTHLGTDPYVQTSAPMKIIDDLAKMMAKRSGGVRDFDSIDDWYAQTIDPSGGALSILPGNIVGNYSITWPTVPKPPRTQAQIVNDRIKRDQIYKDATDPVVYIKGEDGKKAPLVWFGQEVRQSDFYRMKQQWDPIFLAYAGRRANPNELASIIVDGSSEYEVTRKLVNSPDFYKSPTWKSRQPEYATVAEDIFGTGYQPPRDLVKRAILNNWSSATFASFARRTPEYTKSNEFKTKTSSLANIYREIYGEPDEEALVNIREAAAGQWSNDQWAAYLRSQPGYTEGKEYQTKLLDLSVGLAGMMGVLPEAPPTGIPNENANTAGDLPDSPIVEGSPTPKLGVGATGGSAPAPVPQPSTPAPVAVAEATPASKAAAKRAQAERQAREAAAAAARKKYATRAR